jgi:nitrogen fixation NifU-like protein
MGEIKKPDAVGEVGNPICGDVMKVTMKIDPKTKVITDIKFKTFGCVSAIACSSVTTDLIKGKTIDEAKKLDRKSIVDALGELPPIKIHCSVLSADAIKKAIEGYEKKNVK